jgi:membrane-associated protein
MDVLTSLWGLVVHLDRHLGDLIAVYGSAVYLLIFLIVFCETGLVVAPFLPGDSLLFVAGAVWAAAGRSAHPLALVIVAAAFCGDNVNYALGRLAGARLTRRLGGRWINRDALAQTEVFYRRYGAVTVIAARFMPLVRTFAPFVAGLARMDYGRYIVFSVLASLLWVGVLVYAGYSFGNLPMVRENLSVAMGLVVILSFMPVIVQFVRNRLRRR